MTRAKLIFFIAHSGRDVDRARELRDCLHPDIPVFLDVCDLGAGTSWDVELPRRQREALATVALLSSTTEESYYLREEIAAAIAYQRAQPAMHRLIAVFLDGVPSDPAAIPYGVRISHLLDAAKLGLLGVCDQLRRVAADFAGAEPPPPVNLSLDPPDRIALFEMLCRLLPSQFEEILFRVGAPTQHLASATAPLARRALDLVQWAEQGGAPQAQRLLDAVQRTAPGLRT